MTTLERVPSPQLGSRRFTEDEQMAFGRWSHLNVRHGLQKSRGASEPLLRVPRPGSGVRALASESSPLPRSLAGSSAASPRQKPPHPNLAFDQDRVRSVLEQLLPAEGCAPALAQRASAAEATLLPQHASGAAPAAVTPGARSRWDGTLAARGGGGSSPTRTLKRLRSMRSREQVLERFRRRLLQRFRSLFDAFARLHDLATRENALSLEEFCQAFVQVGVKESEAMEVFSAMDCKGKELVSLPELKIALVTTSRQALLWELRCRLLTQGITPNDLSKVKKILEVARRPRHRTVRQRRLPKLARAGVSGAEYHTQDEQTQDVTLESETEKATGGEATYAWAEAERPETATGFLPSSGRLSRTDWLHVCAAIGLTLIEAERLFPLLANPVTGMVDLQEMFAVLRAGVAPHVSLERFATRVLTRYGSLQSAFGAVCRIGETCSGNTTADTTVVMRWPDFHSLAVALDVQDSNAARLWAALTLAERSTQEEGGPVAATEVENAVPVAEATALEQEEVRGITESTFVNELTVWAPGTAMHTLRHQVDEHFSDLAEFRYALGQTGVGLSAALAPAQLGEALLAVGIPGCDAERVCRAVQSARRGGRRGAGVALEEVLEALRGSGALRGSAAQGAVSDDLRPLWQTLHSVQADLQGDSSDCPAELGAQRQPAVARPETATDQTLDELPCARREQHSSGGMKTSASLPSLRRAGGIRSRAARHSRNRLELAYCV